MGFTMLVSAVLALAACSLVDGKSKPAAGWETDYATARSLAGESGRPMFVVFR